MLEIKKYVYAKKNKRNKMFSYLNNKKIKTLYIYKIYTDDKIF